MPSLRLLAAFLLGTALAPGFAQAQNLLVNGSFETNQVPAGGAIAGGSSDTTTLPGWTVTTAAASYFGSFNSVSVPDGHMAVALNAGDQPAGYLKVYQDFATVAGNNYVVTFTGGRLGPGGGVSGVTGSVYNVVGGVASATALASATASTSVSLSPLDFAAYPTTHFFFVATGPTTRIVISDASSSTISVDAWFDDVRVQAASTQTLTILGGYGSPGNIADNTEFSTDNGATWHPAYLVGQHPWGNIPGTNIWINQAPDFSTGLNQTTLFRIKFIAPEVMASAGMTFTVNADNIGAMALNGHTLQTTYGGYPPYPVYNLGAEYIVPGENTLIVTLTDQGGLVGINYRIDLSAIAADPLAVVQLPPTITVPLLSGQVGSPFGYQVVASNSPTSFSASGLPANLSINNANGFISGTPTVAGSFSVGLAASNDAGTGSASTVLSIARAPASFSFSNLVRTYTGSVLSPTVTTNPGNLAYSLSFSGPSSSPVNVGSYPFVAIITNPNYTGTSGSTFTITPASAGVSLGNLVQGYNGSPRPVAVTTSPAGLSTSVTYAGYPSAPSAVGSYPVAATIINPNYTGSATGTLVIADVTPPVLTIPTAPIVAEATSPAGAAVPFTVNAVDDVDGNVLVTTTAASGSTFPLGNTVVTATAKDAANNTATGNFTVTVRDTTAPVLTLPTNQTLEATSAAGAIATFAASATDAVGATLTYSAASGSTFPLETTTVNVSATDAAGNHSEGSFTITVRDTTAPVIAVPANLVLEATSAAGAVATFTSSATDLVDGAVSVTSSVAPGSTFALGTTPITLTATDAAGNVATATFSVTVSDTTAPVIAAQDNLVVEATSADGAVVTFTPSSVDIVNDAVSVVASPASGSTFPLGVTSVTLTATDAAGNSASAAFTITVVDTTAPSIATPANIVAEATSAAGAVVTFNPTASDLVDGAVDVTATPVSGSTFPIGTTTVTLTATDATGNVATSTFTVTVRDTTAPVLATPASQTLEATGPAGASAAFVATATDAVGATVAYSIAPGATFALGTTTVTVTASDAANNVSTGTFTITVQDTTIPALTLPASQTLEATSASGASATFSGSAFDIVSGGLPVAFSPVSGSTFALGSTTVSVTAIDGAHNTATGAFTILVQDTTAPVIAAPADIVTEATGPSGAVATFSASATDIVDGSVAVSSSNASGSTFALGTTTVTLTATDAAHNTSSTTFTVTVRDTTAPTINVPADLVINSSTVLGAAATYTVTATDLVDGTRPVTLSKTSGSTFPIGTTTVTATSVDAAGNTATKSFTVTVNAPAAALVNVISGMNGTIAGSIQQLDDQNVTLNGGAKITGELLVVGTPSTRLNGRPSFGGAVDGIGSAAPSNFTITLNGNATLGKLVRRMDAIALPTVAAPSNPTGTRSVNKNKSSDPVGAWATLKDLTLNGNVGSVAVPAGVYGNFTANGGSGFTLGVAGATTPAVYEFQNLTLNGNSTFKIVGPVIIVLKNNLNANGTMGNTTHPEWLDLRISNGSLTLNGNVDFDGYVTAPKGTVSINGNSELRGGLAADKLVLNGNSTLTLLRR